MLMKKTEIKTNARNFMFFPFSVKVKIRVQRARLWFTPEGISLPELQLLME
jgi:hypothetical protein